jgi:hypothetical protein
MLSIVVAMVKFRMRSECLNLCVRESKKQREACFLALSLYTQSRGGGDGGGSGGSGDDGGSGGDGGGDTSHHAGGRSSSSVPLVRSSPGVQDFSIVFDM